VFDHATPIGEVITATPTYYRIEADFHGRAAHAGMHPEQGRSAILAAAHALAAMPHGRLDEQTTANVGSIRGGVGTTNVVPERCTIVAEARSVDAERVETVVAQLIDAVHDGAMQGECDVDVVAEKLLDGYRHKGTAPAVVAAEAALRACGYEPRRIASGGASDANALIPNGVSVVNLANGTEHAHEPTERVSVAALEGMLDVCLALLDESADLE
jgi:tripeptide aminopeptidase